MTNTDPAGFDSEATGEMRIPLPGQTISPVRPLADALIKPSPVLPATPAGPALVYVHSMGGAQTLVDRYAPGDTYDSPDDRLRELVIARALLVHALRLVDRELNS